MLVRTRNRFPILAASLLLTAGMIFYCGSVHAQSEHTPDDWVPENQPDRRHQGQPLVPDVAPEFPGMVKGAVVKLTDPILGPDSKYGAKFNPTLFRARDHDGKIKFFMVVRAEQNLGDSNWKRRSLPEYAISEDGIHYTMSDHGPLFLPEEDFNRIGGIEDPRYTDLRLQPYVDTDGKSFDGAILYTGFDGKTARVGVALFNHSDPYHFRKLKEPLFPDADILRNPIVPGSAWNKSPAVLQYRDPVSGKVRNVIYIGEGNREHGGIMAMESDSPLKWQWPKPGIKPVIQTRPGKYDQNLVEPAFVPMIAPLPPALARKYGMSHGIYLCLHGDSPPKGYQVGFRIFSLKHPTGAPIYASDGPFLSPDQSWEKEGQVGKVVFASGAYRSDGKLYIAYGAADSRIGLAIADLADPKPIHFWKPGTPEPKLSFIQFCNRLLRGFNGIH